MPDTTGPNAPATLKALIEQYPKPGAAHEAIGQAVDEAGPLDARTCALTTIGICMGAGPKSALRGYVSRATHHGATHDEIEPAMLLAMNTVGFPPTVAGWQWAHQQFERDASS